MLQWYRDTKELDVIPQDGVPAAVIEERIKDLVERRNQIAHRGGNPVNLLGPDEMKDSIDFIEAFAKSLFAMAVGRYLEAHHSASAQRAELVQRQGDGPFQNGTIVIVEKPAQRLFVGQPVFVIAGSTGARWGRIQSLRIHDGDVQTIEPNAVAPQGIGVGLDFRCPKGATLIALSVDDEVVWSPLAWISTASNSPNNLLHHAAIWLNEKLSAEGAARSTRALDGCVQHARVDDDREMRTAVEVHRASY